MSHAHATDSRRTLFVALILTASFAVIELLGGLLAHSLALIGDAGHMATDALALGLGAVAAAVSKMGETHRYSFGFRRAEVLGALVNVLFMYAVIVMIAVEAVERLRHPAPVGGLAVMVIATAGLLINLLVLRLLHAGEQTLNTRGALLHVIGDLLGSVGALLAGLVVWLTGWYAIDPILSLLICLLILVSSTRLLLESVHVVMEGVPSGLSLNELGRSMVRVDPAIREVHDLHVWRVSSDLVSLSAHVVIRNTADWPRVLSSLQQHLLGRYAISHVTLQPELPAEQPVRMASLSGSPPGG